MRKNKFDEFFKDNHFGDKGYWYLRLSNSFFDDSVMEEMLDFPMYGESFFIIFLKLCVKSLEKKGYIRIPQYFSEGNYSSFLAKNIKADPEKVRLAMEYFLTKNLIEIFKSEQEVLFYIPRVENNTGKSSKDADRKRLESRKRKEFLELKTDETSLLETADIEPIKRYGRFKNVCMQEREFEELQRLYENYDVIIDNLSVDKKLKIISPKDDYKCLLEKCKEEGKKR